MIFTGAYSSSFNTKMNRLLSPIINGKAQMNLGNVMKTEGRELPQMAREAAHQGRN